MVSYGRSISQTETIRRKHIAIIHCYISLIGHTLILYAAFFITANDSAHGLDILFNFFNIPHSILYTYG